MTGLNLLLFLGAFLIQYLIGAIIDLWPPGPDGGYHPEGYRTAFWLVGLLLLLGRRLGWRCSAPGSGAPRAGRGIHRDKGRSRSAIASGIAPKHPLFDIICIMRSIPGGTGTRRLPPGTLTVPAAPDPCPATGSGRPSTAA